MADEQFEQRPGARFDPQTGEPLQPQAQPAQQAFQQPAQQPVTQQQWNQGAGWQQAPQQAYPQTGQLAYPQPVYSTNYQVPVVPRSTEPSTLGNWVLTVILSCIPVVGIICLLVWAFGDTADVSKKRWAQAMLIVEVAVVLIYIVAAVVFGVTVASITG